MPRWAVWLLNIVAVAIVYGVGTLANLAGWQLALTFLAGFMLCWVLYGCWRVDDAREDYSRFPPEEREWRRERDRKIDPRL